MRIPVKLFQPNFRTAAGHFSAEWMPYTAGSLWAYCAQFPDIRESFSLAHLGHRREPLANLASQFGGPAIAAFSCYVWNWNYNRQAAAAIKREHPETVVIFGGPQIPERGDTFFDSNPYVDVAVVGEGERPLLAILRALAASYEAPDYSAVPGVMLPAGPGHVTRSDALPRLDLNDIPSPYTAGLFDQILLDYPQSTWNGVFESNRGCPHACTFCDWGSLTYSKVKRFDVDRVRDEIAWFSEHGVRRLFLADANFGIFFERDSAIVDELVAAKLARDCPSYVNMSWTKNSNERVLTLAKRLTDAGINRSMTLAMQSMTPEVQVEIRRKNMESSKFSELLELSRQHGVLTYTELILGLPAETYRSWVESFDTLLMAGQHDAVDVHLCELLENAELNSDMSRLAYGITQVFVNDYFTIDENDLPIIPEGMDIIVGTNTMPPQDLLASYMYAWIIVHFHMFGWTQILTRFLFKYAGIQYSEFYGPFKEQLLEPRTVLSEEYGRCITQITNFFAGDAVVTEDPHSGIRASAAQTLTLAQFAFHADYHRTFDAVRRVSSEVLQSLVPKLDRDLLEDVWTLQRHFISDVDDDADREFALRHNVFEFVNEPATELQRGDYRYRAERRRAVGSRAEYMQRLYFGRKQGWGTMAIRRLVTADAT